MPRKRKDNPEANKRELPGVVGLHGSVEEQPITETLEVNFMPYAMSVIVSRAIPEIDGFKPSHRKLLYTMYKMGLLNGGRTKSANIVGQTMRLNPHGDAAIYETMVRLSRGYGALLHPLVDSKGNFGKVYSRDMAYAASRYTEAKLDAVCAEVFRDIDLDTVDMVDNYDGTMKEPSLLPTAFPNVLVSANTGIAVGMASNICGFNLKEVCDTAIARMRHPDHDLLQTMPAPDFPTGGALLYDPMEMRAIYQTGRGSFKVRAKWRYRKEDNLIEIYEIPYTTTVEAVMDKVSDLIRGGKIREISDMRDETDLSGLKLTIDLKRGVDPEKLMQKLFRQTTLMDAYPCNFNVLIAGMPRVMGVGEILEEWTAWRCQCVKRRVYFQLQKKKDKLHLLKGLGKILLDIDKAIRIIRETELDAEVIPNLMIGFGIDQVQAEYVAEIKLRNINKEFLLNRLQETESLEREIAELEELLGSEKKIKAVICKELDAVSSKYGQPRKTQLVYDHELNVPDEPDMPDYPVTVFISREGYFKKITPQSLRMSGEQKFKEGDALLLSRETTNSAELLVFTDRCQVYKTRLSDFDDGKASQLGDYLPGKLGFDEGESAVAMIVTTDYKGCLLFFFENGKLAKVPLDSYATKTNRKRLANAYSEKSPLCRVYHIQEDQEFLLTSSSGRMLLVHTGAVAEKATRNTQGVAVMTQRKGHRLLNVEPFKEDMLKKPARYRTKSLPAMGSMPAPEETQGEQMKLS